MAAPDLTAQLRPLVDRFLHELEAVLRRAAVEAVEATLVGAPGAGSASDPRPPRRSTKKVSAKPRRGRARIDTTARRILAHIEEHPGARGESIRKALGLDQAAWLLRIQRLIEAGQVTAKGEGRATRYAPAGSARTGRSS